LNKDQKKQVRSILDDGQKEAMPVRDQLLKGRQSIAQAVAAGKSQDEILKMMAKETWLTADEAVKQGFADAQVSTARPLSDREKQMLEAEITRMTAKKVRARYGQDASLLGGAVVQVGSTIYDGSVKGQLDRIREQLVEG